MRRAARITGTLMIVVGLCSIAWALVVWQWQDPFTAAYTKYQQHKLASTFAHEFADYRPPDTSREPSSSAPKKTDRALIAAAARAYRLSLHEGKPVGRMRVPRLGLKTILCPVIS